MSQELERPRVTELHVRMDCNGCVQKIKKALNAIDGIYDIYVDFPNQKVTVVGRADPERIVKAIKKTKKIPTICSHTEQAGGEQAPPAAEQPANGDAPPPEDSLNQSPTEAPNSKDGAEAAAPEPTPDAADDKANDAAVIHMVHEYPHNYVSREHWSSYPSNMHQGMIRHDAAPYHVTHSYNSHRPTAFVSEYGYLSSPSHDGGFYAAGPGGYNVHDYYTARGRADGTNITSIFSDENPNACRIV